jgi:hypothetical protein
MCRRRAEYSEIRGILGQKTKIRAKPRMTLVKTGAHNLQAINALLVERRASSPGLVTRGRQKRSAPGDR